MRALSELIDSYKRDAPLAHASTIPAAWYIDPRVLDLERRTVFARSWQLAGRVDQLQQARPVRLLRARRRRTGGRRPRQTTTWCAASSTSAVITPRPW